MQNPDEVEKPSFTSRVLSGLKRLAEAPSGVTPVVAPKPAVRPPNRKARRAVKAWSRSPLKRQKAMNDRSKIPPDAMRFLLENGVDV